MNDVLISQSYTLASWWNRIPLAAWGLVVAISVWCCVLYGFYATHESGRLLFVSLPVILAITFLLLADLDSRRGGGVIKVSAETVQPHGRDGARGVTGRRGQSRGAIQGVVPTGLRRAHAVAVVRGASDPTPTTRAPSSQILRVI